MFRQPLRSSARRTLAGAGSIELLAEKKISKKALFPDRCSFTGEHINTRETTPISYLFHAPLRHGWSCHIKFVAMELTFFRTWFF